MNYPHLMLKDWPFQIVPDEKYCTFIADRAQLNADIQKTLRNLSRRDQSTIHILWALYGSGKTHSLKYIVHLCNSTDINMIPIYIEFPRGAKSFLDLYKAFVNNLSMKLLVDSYLEVQTGDNWENRNQFEEEHQELSIALNKISMGKKKEVATSTNWLKGNNIPLRELRELGISSRIENIEKALNTFTGIIKLFYWAKEQSNQVVRIIWMIDEFQRIEHIKKNIQQDINGCLTAIFNRCPRSFSLFLSFSGKPSKKMPSWLTKELADRVGLEKVMLLPPLASSEAKILVLDIIEHFRDDSKKPSESSFPFTQKAIEKIISITNQKTSGRGLKPRNILQACNSVLEEADELIENNDLEIISENFVEEVLKDLSFLETEG